MLDRGVDGFLYASMFTREASLPAVLRGRPTVMLNSVPRTRRVRSVVPDEVAAGRTAAEALLAAGHRDHVYRVGETLPHVYAAARRLAGNGPPSARRARNWPARSIRSGGRSRPITRCAACWPVAHR
jgi:DNA-binding LacI/PurR family transcriptional regulator